MTALVGTGGMIRLILRRDRFLLPLWVLIVSALPANFVATFQELYPTAADRMGYASTSGTNPTFLAMYGPLYDTSIGGLVTQRAGVIPVAVALISALVVVRHTRAEEEAGRRELLGSTVVGRQAALAAALIVVTAANVVLAVLTALGTAAQGLPFAGSLALGLQFAAGGVVFAAVAGVTAQLSEGAGPARGIAISALGGAYVLRMAADTGGEGNPLSWLGWLSAIGWAQRLRPFADERWWLLAPVAVLVAVLTAVAWRLSTRRDVGAGLVPPRPGPAEAPPGLNGPFGLGWRLQSRPFYGWLQLPAVWLIAAIALALFGLVPRLTPAAWAAVAVATLITLIGPMLDLGQWALDVSPFTHIPKLPGGDFTATPVLWLLALTAALTATGLTAFRRRDLSLG